MKKRVTEFVTFAGVGIIGFLTDAAGLYCLMLTGSLNPITARFFSFLLANVITWQLNRHHTFPHAKNECPKRQWTKYFVLTSMSVLLNMAIYIGVLMLLPTHILSPLIALIISGIQALTMNYFIAKRFVFAPSHTA